MKYKIQIDYRRLRASSDLVRRLRSSSYFVFTSISAAVSLRSTGSPFGLTSISAPFEIFEMTSTIVIKPDVKE